MTNAPPIKISPLLKRKGLKIVFLSYQAAFRCRSWHHASNSGRLPGFIGPFPPPLWIRVCLEPF